MNEIISKYVNKFKNPKFLIISGCIGILLIFLSTFIGTDAKTPKSTSSSEFSVEQYQEKLEKDVAEIVRGITGSRKVTVVVTLESSMCYKYADITEGSTQDKTENDTVSKSHELKQGYITVKTADGGEQALLITTQMPEVRGVAIVCEGGDNQAISEKIQNSVTAALNITTKRVYIAGGSSNEKR